MAEKTLISFTSGSIPSPEYKTFQKCYQMLINAINSEPATFCDALFEKGCISSDVRDYTRTVGISTTDKARRLVDTVIDRIGHNPCVFHDFIQLEILKSPFHEDMALKLQKCYNDECKQLIHEPCCNPEADSSVKNTPDNESNRTFSDNESDDGFECPYCKKCSMDQFFSEEGCPQKKQLSKARPLFPYLNTSALPENERAVLEMRLKSDTKKMITRFANFTILTRKSIKNRNEPLDEIKDTILSLESFTEGIGVKLLQPQDKVEIRGADTISKVFIVLRSYISFFNYQIIEHLIEHHGSDEDHQRLEEYLNAFEAFCQRNVFEIPPNIFCNSQEIGKKLVFKCTDGVSTLEGVNELKERVAEVFGLQPFALQLCSIEKGCVELHFLIPSAVADCILPVSPLQYSSLGDLGVRVLTCDGVDQTINEAK